MGGRRRGSEREEKEQCEGREGAVGRGRRVGGSLTRGEAFLLF